MYPGASPPGPVVGPPGTGAPPAKPPISRTDLWVSLAVLAVTMLMGAAAAVGGLFSLAFLDYCPSETCSAAGAATAVFSALGAAGVIGALGVIITVVQLVRRRLAWPFAAAALVICAVILAAGAAGYVSAVGA